MIYRRSKQNGIDMRRAFLFPGKKDAGNRNALSFCAIAEFY